MKSFRQTLAGPTASVLRQALGRYRGWAVAAGVWAVLASLATSGIAWVSGPAVVALTTSTNVGISTSNLRSFELDAWGMLGLVLALGCLRVWADFRARITATRLQQNIVHKLRVHLFGHVLRAPISRTRRESKGVIGAKINNEIHGIRALLGLALLGGFRNFLLATTLVIVAFKVDSRLATWGLISLPLAAWGIVTVGRGVRRLQERLYCSEAQLLNATLEAAENVEVIQAYGAQSWALEKLKAQSMTVREQAIHADRHQARSPLWLEFAGALSVGAMLVVSVRVHPAPTLAATVSVAMAWLLAFRPLHGLAQAVYGVASGWASLDRLDSLLIDPIKAPEAPEPGSDVCTGETLIALQNVDFQYDGAQPLLQNANFVLRRGECVGVVGPSGSGKSTLLRLVVGRLTVDQGKAQRPADTRQLAWMPDRDHLFADTITANISFGDKYLDSNRVREAAIDAGAAEFIERLPDTYEHQLSNEGLKLSTGQSRRLSLARALYLDADVLALDEPTGALDHAAGEQICKTLLQLARRGRGVVIATHRPSMIRRMDRLVAIVNGRVVDVTPADAQSMVARDVSVSEQLC